MSSPNYSGVLSAPTSPPFGQQAGSTIGGIAAQQPKLVRPQVTHIEVRRVQNGFVVMAINVDTREQYAMYNGPQRWSYVAKDTAELGALLTSIVDGGCDMDWI